MSDKRAFGFDEILIPDKSMATAHQKQENIANVPGHTQIVPGNAEKPNNFFLCEKNRYLSHS